MGTPYDEKSITLTAEGRYLKLFIKEVEAEGKFLLTIENPWTPEMATLGGVFSIEMLSVRILAVTNAFIQVFIENRDDVDFSIGVDVS